MQNNSSYLFNYVYNYTDHLGNIRLSYGKDPVTGTTKIIKENNYYPFGLSHNNYNMSQKTYVKTNGNNALVPCQTCPRGYQYKYNGKELQDELGLNIYDYGFRNYDPAIARWMNVDPLSEEYRRWSTYNYCMNNPSIFIDPDGIYVDTSWIYEKDRKGNYKNKVLVEAFNTFAKSKEGIAFLSNFAEKGQVIAGHEYKENGKFDLKGIDLNFDTLEEGDWADARTGSVEKKDGLQITIELSDSGRIVDGYLEDIGHEAFAHAEVKANDYSDDKKLNLSVIDNDIVKAVDKAIKNNGYPKRYRENAAHHLQEVREKVLEKKLAPILKNYYNSKNINKTDAEIKKISKWISKINLQRKIN